ncbi:hypothetical protein JFV28_11090 [Pseudomonas sp. TH05]|uniref:hypothetical protein n=1 Tax=unclassified Pseudomonas TaxID=196821 RepID=UPI001912E12D|nr:MULTISPECIES: hypothetical protein [unclassified Pseudomonas]MBK5539261.1 hypothetical protein [Pseudomonas sp. TH07]MBK5556410.1 hypothetical protein [Pseudomonas sp. TH05]
MDTLTATGLAVAIAGVAAYSFYRYRNALTLRVTASQWAVINRALLLARSNPLVGLEIARQLDGHARQIALQGLAPLLVGAGYRQEGLQALGELEKNNLPQPLKEVVELLLDQGDHLAAQALLDQTGVLMPVDGHIALMKLRFAKGDKDGALQILKMIGSVQTQSGADLVSAHDSLRIAPLQRQFGQTECAAMSIAWAWINAREADGSLAPKKLRALLHEFYLQDGATRVIELAQQLHASEKAIAASVLFEFGDLEPAMTLLGEAGKHLPHDAYEQLQRQALAADELDKAERLIELAPAYEHHELLLGLMNWHAKRGATTLAEELLETRIHPPEHRLEVLLRLVNMSHASQPQWSAALLDRASEFLPVTLHGEADNWHRLLILEGQLQAQARLPEARRDQNLISHNLAQLQVLNPDLNLEEKLDRYCAQAPLLHLFGQTGYAVQLLDHLVQQLRGNQEADDIEQLFDLERVARVYLGIDQVEPAIALHEDLRTLEALYRHELIQGIVLNHVQHQRFAEAIAAIDFSILIDPNRVLTALYQALQHLQLQQPEQAHALHQQLLDTLINSSLTTGTPD